MDRTAVAIAALDRIGEALRAEGVTLEELIESARSERTALIAELYGIEDIENTNKRAEEHADSLDTESRDSDLVRREQ